MTQTLVFVVPVYRRFALTRICLEQLSRTCDELVVAGMSATAVVVGDDANLDVAEELAFDVVRQGNSPLGRKFNDGFEHAARCAGADFVVPIGSDNWIDSRLIVGHLPDEGTIRAHRLCAIVDDRGERLARLRISYEGGDGVRIFPTSLLEPLGFRPAMESRSRAIDTSMREQLRRRTGKRPTFVYHDEHPLQIVDFKSPREQLNRYSELVDAFGDGPESRRPFEELSRYFPPESIAAVRTLYHHRRVRALCL